MDISPVVGLPEATELCRHALTPNQLVWMTVAMMTGLASALAVIGVFLTIFKNVISCRLRLGKGSWVLFKSPLDVYMASLLTSELFQASGKLFHVKWLHDEVVRCGSYCNTQGVIQQMGETGVALATLAIAVNTFIIIFFRTGAGTAARTVSIVVITTIWVFVLLFCLIGTQTLKDGDKSYITPSPYWCWINPNRLDFVMAGEYVWIWLAAATSLALYIPLFLKLGGYIQPTGKGWWQVKFVKKTNSEALDSLADNASGDAFKMLLYPIFYCFLILPNSIIRLMEFTGGNIHSWAPFFSTSIFGLSGLCTVILLVYTRPGLLMLSGPPPRQERMHEKQTSIRIFEA